jgi:hypothetical protein
MAVRFDAKRKTWLYVINLPETADGKRRQMMRRGFADEAAARAEERAALARFRQVNLAADGTVAAELDRWLSEREIDLSVTGLSSYRDYIRAYVNPHIGDQRIYALDKDLVHGLYKKLLRSGSREGAPLSPATVRTVHRILQKAFADLGIEIAGIRQPRKPRRLAMGRKGVWTARLSC